MNEELTISNKQCVFAESLVNYLQGKLPPEESAVIDVHISGCESCLKRCEQANADIDLFMKELKSLRGSDLYTIDAQCASMLLQIRDLRFAGLQQDKGSWSSCSINTAFNGMDLETNNEELVREAKIPKDFGRYTIESRLGSGGMATVYMAFDKRLMRQVALKLPHRSIQSDPSSRARFQQEAHAAASITHPNVCGVLDSGEQFGLCYLTMPLLEGRTLASCILDSEPLPLQRALQVVCDLCDAVDAVHANGIVHRDIKPANVFLTSSGKTILMDFGIASGMHRNERLTHHGSLMGTPSYFSPEQAAGAWNKVNASSDIYAIGALFYEILAGRPPYAGSVGEIIGKILHEEPPPIVSRYAEANAALISIASRTMSKRPQDRYPNATSVSVAIRHWVDTYSNQKLVTRSNELSTKLFSQLALATLLIAVTGVGLFQMLQEKSEIPSSTSLSSFDSSVSSSPVSNGHESVAELQDLPSNLKLLGILSPEKVRAAIDPTVRLGDPVVYSLSKDGGRLAVLHSGPYVALWDLTTLTKISDSPASKNDTTLLIANDGKSFLTAGGGWTVRLWDAASKKELAAMPGHRNWINTLDASEDNNWIASSSKDATIRLWGLETKTQQWSQLQGVWMRSVAISPKNDMIAAGGNDGVVRILRCEDGATQSKLRMSNSGILEIRFSPKGEFISTVDAEGSIRVSNFVEMSEVWTGEGRVGGSVRFMSVFEGFACTNREGRIVILSLPTGEPTWTMTRPKIGRVWYAVGFSSDGERLIIRSNEGHVAVLDGKWGNVAKQ